jgi:site-specific DNA-methyltransferase (adenine-specific)
MEINKVYNEDCIETLNRFDENSIDCVITDPPFSGATNKTKSGTRMLQTDGNHIEYDDMSERAFLLFVKPVFRELYRVMKLGSHLYCFTDWKQLRNMADSIELSGFKINNIICWDKGHFGLGGGYRPQSEYILVFSKGLPNSFNLKDVGNVIGAKRVRKGIHPHQKPMELIDIFIQNSTNIGDVIYDPFAGSGVTLISAKKYKRKFIGSELSRDYTEQINEKLNEELF